MTYRREAQMTRILKFVALVAVLAALLVAAVPMVVSFVMSHKTAGLIMPTWIKHAAYSGQLSRNMVVMYPGVI